jgi:hypothetical protein
MAHIQNSKKRVVLTALWLKATTDDANEVVWDDARGDMAALKPSSEFIDLYGVCLSCGAETLLASWKADGSAVALGSLTCNGCEGGVMLGMEDIADTDDPDIALMSDANPAKPLRKARVVKQKITLDVGSKVEGYGGA